MYLNPVLEGYMEGNVVDRRLCLLYESGIGGVNGESACIECCREESLPVKNNIERNLWLH
jgi:hypothetical protein